MANEYNHDYKHYFQDLCDRLSYNCVVFLKESGRVLAYKTLRPEGGTIPQTGSINIAYDTISSDHSRVFYGLNLTLDNRVMICSGSVNVIDVDGDEVIVVFFESRISSFRDNQLPRILWKNANGTYLGHSDYVPYENDLKQSMVGKTDEELFTREFMNEQIIHSDRAILEKEVCFWDMMGKIKMNAFTSLVKLEKFPFYTVANKLAGIIVIYWPINQTAGSFAFDDDDSRSDLQTLVNRALSDANVYLMVTNVENEPKIEYYSDNLTRLGYDFELFIDGRMTLKDVIYPADLDRYLADVKDILYSRREPYSTTIRLLNANREIVWTRISMTPHINKENRINRIALIIQFLEQYQDLGPNYQRLLAIANRTYMVFTVRKANDPYHFELMTDNINQFGYDAQEFLLRQMQFKELIHPDDFPGYEQEIEHLISEKNHHALIEYRIGTRKKQYYWVKENLYLIAIGGIDYLESSIVNVTSTKNAVETLRTLGLAPSDKHTPEFNFATIQRFADLDRVISAFSRASGVGALVVNNSGFIQMVDPNAAKAWEIIRESLGGFDSFAANRELKTKYADLALSVHPIEKNGNRIGTLLLYGRIAGKQGGALLHNDLGLFPPVSEKQMESLGRYAGIIATNIAFMIDTAALATLHVQTSVQSEGVATRQERGREVFFDVLEIAMTCTDINECFRRMMPIVGPALMLSRASLSAFTDAFSVFHVVEEWNDAIVAEGKSTSENIDRQTSALADWNPDANDIFVVNTPDLVSDPNGTREYAKAFVTVRVQNLGQDSGFLTFIDNHSRRIWNPDEIELIQDLSRMLNSVFAPTVLSAPTKTTKLDFIRILNSLPNAVAIVKADTASILYANGIFTNLFLERDAASEISDEVKGDEYVKSLLAVETTANAAKEIYLREIDRWFLVNRSAVNFNEINDAEMVILTDITTNKKTQETISSLAFTDVLTGLPNRSKFEIDLRKTYEMNSAMYTNSFIGILNIDNFKLINNMYSYSFGDSLLKTLTIHLNKIPEIRDKIYRFGGDEFAFLVKNLYGEQVYEVAHKVMRIFDTPFYIDGYETACTVSLGIAFLNDTNKDPNDLIRKANLSLADAKASGKNKFILYDISLQKFEEDTVSIERALKTAVDDGCGEFKVYFQPIIDAKTGKIIAAEALVRWFSPEYGFVSPVKFIPIAEQTGLIIPLGKYILNTAVKEAKKWLDYGRDIAVSVNFSVIQTLQTDLVQTILKALQMYKLPARNLLFEITESLAINDVNKVIEILTSVKQIGVKIAMDDFGTGYSSLNHLRRMPLDYVKIDRSFIFNIEFDPYTVSFVDTIAKFCHMKGTKICCEGVENETQKNLLKSVNADSLQGYLFGKPAPAEEFWKRLLAD